MSDIDKPGSGWITFFSILFWGSISVCATTFVESYPWARALTYRMYAALPNARISAPSNTVVVLVDDEFKSPNRNDICPNPAECRYGNRIATLIGAISDLQPNVIALDIVLKPDLKSTESKQAMSAFATAVESAVAKEVSVVLLERTVKTNGKIFVEPSHLRNPLEEAPASAKRARIAYGFDRLRSDPRQIPMVETYSKIDQWTGSLETNSNQVFESFAYATARLMNSKLPVLENTEVRNPLAKFWNRGQFRHCRAIDLLAMNEAAKKQCFDRELNFRDMAVLVGTDGPSANSSDGSRADLIKGSPLGEELGVFIQASYISTLFVPTSLLDRMPKWLFMLFEVMLVGSVILGALVIQLKLKSAAGIGSLIASGFGSHVAALVISITIFFAIAFLLATFGYVFDVAIPAAVSVVHLIAGDYVSRWKLPAEWEWSHKLQAVVTGHSCKH